MEYLLIWIKYGTPGIILILLFLVSYLTWSIKDIRSDIKDLKNGVVWQDEFKQFEKRVNGK